MSKPPSSDPPTAHEQSEFFDDCAFSFPLPYAKPVNLTAERMKEIMVETILGREPVKPDTTDEENFRSYMQAMAAWARIQGVTLDFTPE